VIGKKKKEKKKKTLHLIYMNKEQRGGRGNFEGKGGGGMPYSAKIASKD